MADVPSVNDTTFDQEVIQSDVPVLVDFSATWCGPCKMIAPFVAELADEYEGRVKVRMVDIDQSPGSAAKYGVRGVPTLKVFKNGSIIAEQVGAAPKQKLEELIKKAL